MKKILSLSLCVCCLTFIAFCQDGTIDSSFGINGRAFQSAGAELANSESQIKIQGDKKIVQIGSIKNSLYYDFVVYRYSPDGTPDATFGSNGKVVIDFGGSDDFARSVAIQADGKIIVVGKTDVDPAATFLFKMAILRLNTDGSLDLSFNTSGKSTLSFGIFNDFANSVIIQADGKIIVGGTSDQGATVFVNQQYDFALARLNPDGALDNSFGNAGKIIASGIGEETLFDLALQADGRIVAAGEEGDASHSLFALLRYNTDGSPDLSFGNSGKVNTAVTTYSNSAISIDIQSDGKIVAAGEGAFSNTDGLSFIIARYNTNGSLDSSFNGNGMLFFKPVGSLANNCSEVLIQPDNKILVVGTSTLTIGQPDFAVMRYNVDGSPDQGFGFGGLALLKAGAGWDYAWSVGMQGSKIIIGGSSVLADNNRYFSLVRLKNTIPDFCNSDLQVTETHSDLNCYAGNKGAISVSVTGGTAPYKYNWSNGQTTKDISSLISGTYQLTVSDSFGCLKSISVIISNTPVSCPEKEIIVYPNPASGLLKIKFTGYQEPVQITMYDAIGRKIKAYFLQVTNPFIEEIKTQYLSPGIYFIEIEISNRKVVKKCFIQ